MRPYAVSYEIYPESRDELDDARHYAPRGRVLSVPEINEIRRRHDPLDRSTDNPWNMPFVTSSTEYRGPSASGKELVVIHHPKIGELAPDGRRMEKAEFRRLLDGAYGEVEVFEAPEANTREPRDYWHLTAARFGGECMALALAKQLQRQIGLQAGERGLHVTLRKLRPREEDQIHVMPLVAHHLRSIERGQRGAELHGFCKLVVETFTKTQLGRPLCIAIQQYPETPISIAPPVTRGAMLNDPWKTGWIEGRTKLCELQRLRTFDGRLMTDGTLGGTCPPLHVVFPSWPKHDVRSFTEIGKMILVDRTIGKLVDIGALAPESANAYRVIEGNFGVRHIVFGQAIVDGSKRFPDERAFTADWYLRREVATEHAARWWQARTQDAPVILG